MNPQQDMASGFFAGAIALTCLHGLLLAAIFLFHKRFNPRSNRFLAMAVLGICIILAYECVGWLGLEEVVPDWILFLPLYIRSTIPVGIFYFVLFLIQPDHNLTPFEKSGFIFIGSELLLDLLFIPTYALIHEPATLARADSLLTLAGMFVGTASALVFLPIAFIRVRHYQQYLFDHYSTTDRKSLSWLQVFLGGFLLATAIWMICFGQYLMEAWEALSFTFGMVTLCFVILLFGIGYFLILNHSWFEIATLNPEEDLPPSPKGRLSSVTSQYYQQLLSLIHEEKAYHDVNLTLDNLAERLQISSGYLSQIIKEHAQQNFFEFINSYRIEAVKEKLLDETYQHYTIMGIATDCGFNSKSTFNSVFKKFTGVTPSSFRKQHAA